MTSEQIASLQPALTLLMEKFRHCFKREKTLHYWKKYILGLMADLKRKSIEPIALAAEVPVRTLQEFLADFRWDHQRAEDALHRLVADKHGCDNAIGVIDASSHPKQGPKTPGVQRQWCGQTGKIDNCVVGQHLLYTDNDPTNPFSCVLASDLFLPSSWDAHRDRCRVAGIPDDVVHRPKWKIAVDQIRRAMCNGIRFSYVVFDEDYGQIPEFWFSLDRMGQRGVGEVRKNFQCWATPPQCRSLRAEHAPKRVDNLVRRSGVFTKQSWQKIKIKNTTRGPSRWKFKAARVQLTNTSVGKSVPTDRRYWLIVARCLDSSEIKYFVSNVEANANPKKLLRVAFARWHVEKWFERAKQEAGLGAFEVRTYTGLIRHWLSSRIAMYFLGSETQRLRGGKSADHVGTGSRCGQHAGCQDMEDMAAFMGRFTEELRVLPMAQ